MYDGTLGLGMSPVLKLSTFICLAYGSFILIHGRSIADTGYTTARHINYGCNMIFGFAYGMACGGIPVGILFSGVYFLNFTFNAGPSIEEYCRDRYREKWDAYCKKVPNRFIPWLYWLQWLLKREMGGIDGCGR